MLVYKTIEVSLDIEDPISTYANANTNILRKLQAKYEGRCYAGCFIMKVLNIVKRSECIIMQNTESCDGSINVMFRAQVIQLLPGEVLHNNKIIKKELERKLLVATNNICSLNINTEGIYDSVAPGQKVPAVIVQSLCTVGSDHVTAYANPYVPTAAFTAYNFNGVKVEKKHLETLKEIKSLIDDAVEKFEELLPADVEFFSNLIYPFKTKKTITDKVILLDDIKEGVTLNVLARPSSMDLNKKQAYFIDPTKYTCDVKNVDAGEGIHALYTEFYQRIELIIGFVETYKTKDDKESHINLWKIFNNIKTT
jgi:hypothetical protein